MESFEQIIPISLKTVTLRSGAVWVLATTLNEAFQAIQRFQADQLKFRIVGGNTSSGNKKLDIDRVKLYYYVCFSFYVPSLLQFAGIFKKDLQGVQGFIDVNHVPELHQRTLDTSEILLGGGTTLSAAIDHLKRIALLTGFQYANGLAKHWGRVANTSVRNVATLAGNLMLKREHRDFPSDVFLTLEAVQAELAIASAPSMISQVSLTDFMELDMTGKVIVSIRLKPLTAYHIYRSFKVCCCIIIKLVTVLLLAQSTPVCSFCP